MLSEVKGIIHGISTRIEGEGLFHNNLSKHVGDDVDMVMKNRERFYAALGINSGGSLTPIKFTQQLPLV